MDCFLLTASPLGPNREKNRQKRGVDLIPLLDCLTLLPFPVLIRCNPCTQSVYEVRGPFRFTSSGRCTPTRPASVSGAYYRRPREKPGSAHRGRFPPRSRSGPPPSPRT